MGKFRKENLGDRANENNFFDITDQNRGLMQPIQNAEKATRSGKIFSPEKLKVNRTIIDKSLSKSYHYLDLSNEDVFKISIGSVSPRFYLIFQNTLDEWRKASNLAKNACRNFKGFQTAHVETENINVNLSPKNVETENINVNSSTDEENRSHEETTVFQKSSKSR